MRSWRVSCKYQFLPSSPEADFIVFDLQRFCSTFGYLQVSRNCQAFSHIFYLKFWSGRFEEQEATRCLVRSFASSGWLPYLSFLLLWTESIAPAHGKAPCGYSMDKNALVCFAPHLNYIPLLVCAQAMLWLTTIHLSLSLSFSLSLGHCAKAYG